MMKLLATRARLLGSATLGLGLTMVAAQPAQAACVVTATTVTCATTTTTDTTNAGGTPASDRNYPVDTSAAAFTGTVSAGAVVDGYGLAFTNTVGGANALNVVNNGAVQVNAGNTPTTGVTLGQAALNITAIGATPINYSGTGSLTNLGGGLGDGLDMVSAGTGNITAVVGGNITAGSATTGAFSFGIGAVQSGTAGNISVTTATGTTIRAGDTGIFARVSNAASPGTITVTNGASILSRTGAPNTLLWGIRALSSGLGAVSVANTGAIGSATDRTVTAGIIATIFNAASVAALSVTGSGAIWSAGPGISASNAGTGTTTVNYTGAINTTGATGVSVSATTGATTVTLGAVTAATDAVVVTSTGTQAITLNGVTTGTAGSGLVSNTTGARTITVGAAGNVTGGTQAILLSNTGTATITNNGIIGAASTGLAVNGVAAGNTTVTNSSTGTLNGRLTFGTGADSLVNSGTFNTQGTTDFGAGTDVLTNNASGIINILGATSFTGLETFTQNGRINLNNFTLTGPAILFTNGSTGFIDTSGNATIAGFTALSNAGTIDLAAGTFTVPAGVFTNTGTVIADEGAATITGQSSFANSGTITMVDGVPNDVLTIVGPYVGSGAAQLKVDYSGPAVDKLVISGAASGTTTLNVTPTSGMTFNPTGLLVVDTGTSTANAFVLGTPNFGLIDLRLNQVGQDYFLSSLPNIAAIEPVVVGDLAQNLWYQSADIYSNYSALRRSDLGGTRSNGLGVWGQIYYSEDRTHRQTVTVFGNDYNIDRFKTKRRGAQAGVDYLLGGNAVIGITGGYERAQADIRNSASDFRATGYNIGGYGIFGGPTGFFGDLLVKYDRAKLRFDNPLFASVTGRPRLTSWGAQGEVGYRFGSDAIHFDLDAGLAYVRSKIDDYSVGTIAFDNDRVKSTRGHLGARATFGTGAFSPFVDGKLFHEFNGDDHLTLISGTSIGTIVSKGRGTWGRVEAGIGAQNGSGPILAGWGDFGDVKGFGVKAGWRFGGAREVIAPPPPPSPPPPPPPPPATQTCPDGSVILATDACPLPPPPPPPPPPEPERG